MVSLFKSRSPIAIVWLIVLSIIVHSHLFLQLPVVSASGYDGLFSLFLIKYVLQLPPFIKLFIYHLIIIIQALRLSYLFSENRMYSQPNYLSAMVYILLTGIFSQWCQITPALIDNFLLIWLYAKTVQLYNAQDPKTLLFNIGLIIGVSVLCYHPSALLIIVALFALLVVRAFNISELLVLLMGVVTPYYFLAAWLFLFDLLHTFTHYIPDWQLNFPDDMSSGWFLFSIGIILVILLIGMYYWQSESLRLLIHVRKNWGVLMVMLLVMLLIPFINSNVGLDSLVLWLIPFSPFIAKALLAPKKLILPNIIFFTLLLLGLARSWAFIE